MSKKLSTIKLQGNTDYSKVSVRLKEFREANPHGSIETKPTILEEGTIMFQTVIIKNLADPHSARATGSALGKGGAKQKEFEKLETISVGRALALLGYGADGEIASSEEMDEFHAFKNEKKTVAMEQLRKAKNIEELKTIFKGLGSMMAEAEIVAVKNEMKAKLTQVPKEFLTPPVVVAKKTRAKKVVKIEEGEVPADQLPDDLK